MFHETMTEQYYYYDFFFHFCRQVPVPKLMWIIKPKPMLLLEK